MNFREPTLHRIRNSFSTSHFIINSSVKFTVELLVVIFTHYWLSLAVN